MAEVHRIQELDLFTRKPDCILRVLSLNGPASAPLLQRLRLKSLVSPNATSIPPDILRREKPSLRRLELEDFYFSPGLPPLPHLTYLKISLSLSTMTPSSLLISLRYATSLKEIDIAGMAKDDPSDLTMTRVQLPNLVRISITSNHIESATIFANLDPRPSTLRFTMSLALPVSTWVQNALTEIFNATIQTAFDHAFDACFSQDVTVVRNDANVARDEYKKALKDLKFPQQTANVKFSGSVSSRDEPSHGPLEVCRVYNFY
ncbi:hypothetical protein EYR38_010492 [Pleurotus pulmonarius]|nr:hypothetical protein EYR38_010492 [Pleurotus pulmonarius]